MENHLCNYGCGKLAGYQLKNGRWCCSKNFLSCSNIINKRISKVFNGNFKRVKSSNYLGSEKCAYGCGKKAKFQFKNGKKCCSNDWTKCESNKQNVSNRFGGCKNPCKEETKIKLSKSQKGIPRKKHTKETKNKMSKTRTGKKVHNIESKKKIGESSRIRMLNGGSDIAHKAIKKISKQEKCLVEYIKQIYPDAIPQYKVFRYKLDIALPEYKIAIEYDGYYHFDSKNSIDYYSNRQKRIEDEGWKFLRYTMFDKFPSFEEFKNKLTKIVNESKMRNFQISYKKIV